jgi:hypothetical protein
MYNRRNDMKLTFTYKGGAGSGHHGHAGRPGEQGGSLPDAAASNGTGYELFNVKLEGKGSARPAKTYRLYDTRSEVEEKFKRHEEVFKNKLTEDEHNALYSYTEENYINEDLRSKDPLPEDSVKQRDLMDSAIAKGKMPSNATVVRVLIVEESYDLKNLIGKTISDAAYLSTSLESELYGKLYEPLADDLAEYTPPAIVTMHILVDKGARVGLLGSIADYSSSEVILPRNAKLSILNVYDVLNENMKIGDYRNITIEAHYVSE